MSSFTDGKRSRRRSITEGSNQVLTAKRRGMSRRTLLYKMVKYKLRD